MEQWESKKTCKLGLDFAVHARQQTFMSPPRKVRFSFESGAYFHGPPSSQFAGNEDDKRINSSKKKKRKEKKTETESESIDFSLFSDVLNEVKLKPVVVSIIMGIRQAKTSCCFDSANNINAPERKT
ncbi:hypothetical protein GQ457_10G027030 [Hibiscus cannabinus]